MKDRTRNARRIAPPTPEPEPSFVEALEHYQRYMLRALMVPAEILKSDRGRSLTETLFPIWHWQETVRNLGRRYR